MKSALTALKEHNDMQTSLHVRCVQSQLICSLHIFEKLKETKENKLPKLNSACSSYLDYSQPNVDIILDKNVNMTKVYFFQSISFDKSFEILPTQKQFSILSKGQQTFFNKRPESKLFLSFVGYI